MAFTGTAVFEQLSGNIVRVTGLSLAGGASGTIGLAARTVPGEKTLPPGFQPTPYGSHGLVAALQVTAEPTDVGCNTSPVLIAISKAGATPQTWLATLANLSVGDSQDLEIFVKFHD